MNNQYNNLKKVLLSITIAIIIFVIVLATIIIKKNKKSDIDIFYNDEITNEYEDLRNLSEDYNIFDAQMDKCFVVGAMLHNDYLYGEFIENYKKGKDSFVRIARNSTSKDLILFDIMYKSDKKEFIIVTDYTRDTSKNKEDRIIKLSKYKNISEYKYKESTYLVLYNGELNDETFNSENVFKVITLH